MKVVIVGAGNVATVLGKKIQAAGHEVVQVISRSLHNAKRLAVSLNSSASDNLLNISTSADIYMIAVSDDAIEEIARQLKLKNKLVVHTAGSVSKEILKNIGSNYGVLYPLQSLRKEMESYVEIPIIVDGNSRLVIDELITFAFPWAKRVWECGDEQRLKLHLAAVVTSNFSNHLFALAEQYCESEELNFKLLVPLLKETVGRIERHSPSDLQTGPAIRGDLSTLQKHRELLSDYPELQKVYTIISDSIISQKKGKND